MNLLKITLLATVVLSIVSIVSCGSSSTAATDPFSANDYSRLPFPNGLNASKAYTFNNRLWLLLDYSNNRGNVLYNSLDSQNYYRVASNINFNEYSLSNIDFLEHNNNLYLFVRYPSERDGILRSSDGINFVRVRSSLPWQSEALKFSSFNNKIWAYGSSGSTKNLWSSVAGLNWQAENSIADVSYLNATVLNNKLYLVGTKSATIVAAETTTTTTTATETETATITATKTITVTRTDNVVVTTTDGSSWQQSNTLSFSLRAKVNENFMFTYKDKLFVTGFDNSLNLYYSTNGLNWQVAYTGINIEDSNRDLRYYSSYSSDRSSDIVIYQNKIWSFITCIGNSDYFCNSTDGSSWSSIEVRGEE